MLMLLIAVIALEVSCGPEENDDANPMPARQASQALIPDLLTYPRREMSGLRG